MTHCRKSKWRLYADNNVEKEIVDRLRASGMDVLWVGEEPELERQRDDRFHYEGAGRRGRWLLTRDQGFWDDRRFPLGKSPGVLIIACNNLDLAGDLVKVLQKRFEDAAGEPVRPGRAKVKLTSEGFVIKDVNQPEGETFQWKDFF